MGVTIIVGGQYGSEGKGKVTALVAARCSEPIVVRCGGPNSGHTVSVGEQDVVLRQLPAAITHPAAVLVLSAGCVIDEEILLREVEQFALDRDRIIVDPRAVVLSAVDRAAEKTSIAQIGSTGSGTGAALVRRMQRGSEVHLAANSKRLLKRVRIETVAPLLHRCLDRGGDVVVEGTQGFGLSLLHGPDFPYLTSRDTTAAGFAMEAGLSPRHVSSIVMVLRTFPIRVGGNSGPFKSEISWKDIQAVSKSPECIPEFTSVTKRVRRVAQFDMEAVKTACRYNRPTSLALMGLDRLDYRNDRVNEASMLTETAMKFLNSVEHSTGVPVEWGGTGFRTCDAIHFPVMKTHLG